MPDVYWLSCNLQLVNSGIPNGKFMLPFSQLLAEVMHFDFLNLSS